MMKLSTKAKGLSKAQKASLALLGLSMSVLGSATFVFAPFLVSFGGAYHTAWEFMALTCLCVMYVMKHVFLVGICPFILTTAIKYGFYLSDAFTKNR